ncbi:MAG: CPBP family intramembrane metalloprotease [Phycisphaerae bacterium]|nr:CPBP family intramembrane metalloprotease [Phycisphaerae bacterium]
MNEGPPHDPAVPAPSAASASAAPSPPSLPPAPAPPTPAPVADVFLAYAVAMFAGIVAIVAVIVAVVLVRMAQGHAPESIQQWLTTSPAVALVLTNTPFQLACFSVALLWRWHRGKTPARRHLAIVSPGLSPAQWLVVLVAGGVPFALSLVAASVLPSLMSTSGLTDAWSTMPVASAAVWILYIGLFPGVCEEMLFRGLIFRRFMRRWGVVASLAASSTLFAIAHVDPPAMALAFTLGVWLGYLTWRTGSILPSIATHIAVNSLWNLGQIVLRQAGLSEQTNWIIAGVIGVASLVCFVAAIKLLSSRPAPAIDGQYMAPLGGTSADATAG